ncbi:MAG: hypothetical protein JW768_13095 [Chitinispirillaceae bacterium]|nr:hypothetical protein [Chitinispirillaceae bacterium]
MGAVAFSIILFIASLGYLQVVASSSNSETTGFWDDKAFAAAESGLLMGMKWLSQQKRANDKQNPFSLIIPNPRAVYSETFGNIPVSVSIEYSNDTAVITSIATTGELTYNKQIVRAVIAEPIPSGSYGVYLDNAWELGGNTNGIRKMTWDGPAHFNTALQLGNPGGGNEAQFLDKVTLFNINPVTNNPVYIPTNDSAGHFGNDYRWGVDGGSGNWDDEFQKTYDPNADKIVTTLDANGSVPLTLNDADNSLTFGVNAGTPFYTYISSTTGNPVTETYDPNSDLKLHIVDKEVSVSGIVKGKVTVYTDPGKNIYINNDLTYHDFSTASFSNTDLATNHGYGMSSANVLGLYSGADFIVSEGTHNITALLFAVNQDINTLVFQEDQQNKTQFNLFGTLAVKGFWDSKQGNDQADFNQLWDRRGISAPGLEFEKVDDNNDLVFNLLPGTWTESNYKPN